MLHAPFWVAGSTQNTIYASYCMPTIISRLYCLCPAFVNLFNMCFRCEKGDAEMISRNTI